MFIYITTFDSRGGESKPSLWPRGPPVWDVRQASFCRHHHVNHRTTIINITFIISNISILLLLIIVNFSTLVLKIHRNTMKHMINERGGYF